MGGLLIGFLVGTRVRQRPVKFDSFALADSYERTAKKLAECAPGDTYYYEQKLSDAKRLATSRGSVSCRSCRRRSSDKPIRSRTSRPEDRFRRHPATTSSTNDRPPRSSGSSSA